MATLSFSQFSQGQPVQVVGNETTQQTPTSSQEPSGIKRLADISSKNILDQARGGISKIKESVLGGAERMQQGVDQGGLKGAAQFGRAALETGLGAASGAVQAGFSPVTGIVETGIQGLNELDQVTGGNVRESIKSIADNHPEAIKTLSDFSKKHPQATTDLMDIINVMGAKFGANKTLPLVDKAITSTEDAVVGGLKGAGDVLGDATKGIVSKVTPTSEGIMQRVARIPKGEQAKFEALTGESVGSYLDKRGIYGEPEKIVEQLYTRFNQSKQTADEALATIQGTYRATPVRTALKELEGKVERTSSPGAPDPEYSRVKELIVKEKTEGLTMSEINEVKRIYERRVRLDYLKTNVPEDVARATNVDTALREWQMAEADKAGLKNLAEINKETQATKKLMDALGKENAGVGGNNALGLTDAILIAGGSPESIASLLIKKTFSDKGLQSYVAKKLSPNKEKLGVPEAQFKEKLQLGAPQEGAPQSSNYQTIEIGKSQSKADLNLESMNAKKAKLQSQEKLQESSTNNTSSKKKVNSLDGYNFERAKGLSKSNEDIETKSFEKIVNQEDKLLADYKAKHGKEINTDNFRPMFKDVGYNGANAAAVQEPSSYLSKKAFTDALKNDGEFAMFTGGGSGVGKSSGVKSISELSKLKDESAVIFDSNLSSYDSAIKKIKEAKEAGKQFAGVYTYRDPVDSLVEGVIKRMRDNPEEMGRIVPTKVIADNHIKSLEVVKRLIGEGYDFRIVDNSTEGGKAKLTTLKEIEQKAKYPSVQELTDIMNKKVKELYDKGELTPEQYKEYVN